MAYFIIKEKEGEDVFFLEYNGIKKAFNHSKISVKEAKKLMLNQIN